MAALKSEGSAKATEAPDALVMRSQTPFELLHLDPSLGGRSDCDNFFSAPACNCVRRCYCVICVAE
jgi:hypothetical protein